MPKFKVTLEREATQYAEIMVSADDSAAAEKVALSHYDAGKVEWELSGYLEHPYVAEVEQITPESVELEPSEKEQLIELLASANGDYGSILVKLGYTGTTANGETFVARPGVEAPATFLFNAATREAAGAGRDFAADVYNYLEASGMDLSSLVSVAREHRDNCPTMANAFGLLKLYLMGKA